MADPIGMVKNANLLQGREVKLIGLIVDDDGDMVLYKNLVVTINNGKITDVEKHGIGYSETDAINDATGWIDNHYWGVK
jgi:hypothetical protein